MNYANTCACFIIALTAITCNSYGQGSESDAGSLVKWSIGANFFESDNISLGKIVPIYVRNGEKWFFNQVKNEKSISVFLNGIPLRGVNLLPIDIGENRYQFHLRRDAVSPELWPSIRSRAAGHSFFDRPVELAFGEGDSVNFEVGSTHSTLKLIRSKVVVFWMIIVVALMLLFISLARRSNILRDGVVPPGAFRPPLSLARTQMAIWLFIIVFSYLWLWLITGNLETVDGTALALMGISASTYISAALIENSAAGNALAIKRKKTDIAELEESLSLTEKNDSEYLQLRQKLVSLQSQIDRLEVNIPQRKLEANWIMQLLSDSTGVKLHRFQILTWTIILGLIFVIEVVGDLAMPKYSATLLGLMGISSGKYLGFKFPEVKGEG